MNGRVLRSGDPAGVEQEMWALLTLYQALRTMMVEAAESLHDTDPDRCCFTIALQTARDQVVQAAAVITDPADAGRVGLIGHPSPATPTAARQHPQGHVTDVPLQHPP
ncbi:hypothetical protein [Streptomyces coelicoflavus]|uniref:hypothetical protein n=1 Tax=Streptomyces coelicoflavus TaxID=285562 RepID=UPI002E273F63